MLHNLLMELQCVATSAVNGITCGATYNLACGYLSWTMVGMPLQRATVENDKRLCVLALIWSLPVD
eukprot:11155217-Karenia_brevis.AAC.1